MPYEWTTPDKSDNDPALHVLSLWPYRSLPRKGFVWFIAITVAMLCLPLLALLGTFHLWQMLPFMAAAVGAIWYFIERSYKDGSTLETLTIWRDRITLTRQNPRGPNQHWEANPYWVTVNIHQKGGPVEQYLTLRGDGREVEIGAFLTPIERIALYDELQQTLAKLPR